MVVLHPSWNAASLSSSKAPQALVFNPRQALVFEPLVTPFEPTSRYHTIESLWELQPHAMAVTAVLYSPWEVDLFSLVTLLSPTFEIRVRGVPVPTPSDGLVVAAVRSLHLLGAVRLGLRCVFDTETAPDAGSDASFYDRGKLLAPATTPWDRGMAEKRIFELLQSFDGSDAYSDISLLGRCLFKFKRCVWLAHGAEAGGVDPYWKGAAPRQPEDGAAAQHVTGVSRPTPPAVRVVYIAPDCIFLDAGGPCSPFDIETCVAVCSLDRADGLQLRGACSVLRLDFDRLRPFFSEALGGGGGLCADAIPMQSTGLSARVRGRQATVAERANAVFDRPGPISGCATESDTSSEDESSSETDTVAPIATPDDGAESAQRVAALLSAPPLPFNCAGARSISVYTASPIDVWLDEFVDLNRLQDALRWRSLTRKDAAVLVLFEKLNGRHCVNYNPPEDPPNTAKKAKKDPKPPTGLAHLSPGVRQFVLQLGTVCIDAPHWKDQGEQSRKRRPDVCAAIATFWQRGSEVGLLPSGVRLVSIVPEGFLVRGFMDAPPPDEMLEMCRAVVKHDVGVDVGTLEVMSLVPLGRTSHPLAGDFRLWDESDLGQFDGPLFLAMRNVIENPPHPRAFNWFYETEGNLGKTAHAKYYAQRGACCVSAQTPANIFFAIKEHVNRSGTLRLLIVDVPRDMGGINETFAGAIESIKDGLVFSGKYESGTIKLPSPTVIIFANAPMPDSFKYALSPDRWREVNLRETRVHSVTNRFVLCADAFPGVYTDKANYAVLQELVQRTEVTASGGRLHVTTHVEGV